MVDMSGWGESYAVDLNDQTHTQPIDVKASGLADLKHIKLATLLGSKKGHVSDHGEEKKEETVPTKDNEGMFRAGLSWFWFELSSTQMRLLLMFPEEPIRAQAESNKLAPMEIGSHSTQR